MSIMIVYPETAQLSVKQTQGHIEQEDLNRLFSLLSRYGFVCYDRISDCGICRKHLVFIVCQFHNVYT